MELLNKTPQKSLIFIPTGKAQLSGMEAECASGTSRSVSQALNDGVSDTPSVLPLPASCGSGLAAKPAGVEREFGKYFLPAHIWAQLLTSSPSPPQ